MRVFGKPKREREKERRLVREQKGNVSCLAESAGRLKVKEEREMEVEKGDEGTGEGRKEGDRR